MRQQERQGQRLLARTFRTNMAMLGAVEAAALTGGYNRKDRRQAYAATRRRNDGRVKKLVGQRVLKYR